MPSRLVRLVGAARTDWLPTTSIRPRCHIPSHANFPRADAVRLSSTIVLSFPLCPIVASFLPRLPLLLSQPSHRLALAFSFPFSPPLFPLIPPSPFLPPLPPPPALPSPPPAHIRPYHAVSFLLQPPERCRSFFTTPCLPSPSFSSLRGTTNPPRPPIPALPLPLPPPAPPIHPIPSVVGYPPLSPSPRPVRGPVSCERAPPSRITPRPRERSVTTKVLVKS